MVKKTATTETIMNSKTEAIMNSKTEAITNLGTNPLFLAFAQLGVTLSEGWEERFEDTVSLSSLSIEERVDLINFCSVAITRNTCTSIPFATGSALVDAVELICCRAQEAGRIKQVDGQWWFV
jgi:hypothetical protein